MNLVDSTGLWANLVGPVLRTVPALSKVFRGVSDAFLPPSGGLKDVIVEGGKRIIEDGVEHYDERVGRIQEGRFGKNGEKIDEYYNQTWKR